MGSALPRDSFVATRLEQVFHRCFAASENTRLIGGASEPVYLPAGGERPCSELYYREDFFASALHEIAHWCIAGRERRLQVDFGYWYAPEGRNAGQQQAFEAVEVKPQALEWILSQACAYRFRLSADNFNADGSCPDNRAFADAVTRQAAAWQAQGLPPRAALLFTALAAEFRSGARLAALVFERDSIL
ncbi:elongation factor P hydroxylase [Haliea sp. E17]|uniref:elongation factor P hydroxylase n=1 Tax=Haliea sp. E17 TaxID=3401576 RepID=UPI003AADC318